MKFKLKVAAYPLLILSGICVASEPTHMPRSGSWRGVISSPGGELPFGLEIVSEGASISAWILNGPERISVPEVRYADGELILSIDYYDSTIRAKLSGDADRLDGEWRKQSSGDSVTTMPFHATFGSQNRFPPKTKSLVVPSATKFTGRWLVKFEKSEDPAVGVFRSNGMGIATGTFMTTTGDYRFLAGDFDGERMRLSCFDGAHAFLFHAKVLADGSLEGDFWSRDSWHETWTAKRDEKTKLPDAFGQTTWHKNVSLGDITFPDVDEKLHSLMDESFKGQARILVVFGSWCPNCHDASNYLVELHKRYKNMGLSIVGLAFELTGDFKRDARQVKKYVEKHGIEYPVLVAGVADKKKAGEALPFLSELRSFPTTIFLSADGKVRAVHTGFMGPATGQAYRDLRIKFETTIEQLLSE